MHPVFAESEDKDTDPELFGPQPESVTARYCSVCGRGYDLFSLSELQRWLKLNMTDQQAANVARSFQNWADKL